jgi:hypothetical protein
MRKTQQSRDWFTESFRKNPKALEVADRDTAKLPSGCELDQVYITPAIELNAVVILVARVCRLETATMAISAITRAYSTKSWPSSCAAKQFNLKRALFRLDHITGLSVSG